MANSDISLTRGIIAPAYLALSSLLSGCALDSLGLGNSEYRCPAPQGGPCRSVSEIHADIAGQESPPSSFPWADVSAARSGNAKREVPQVVRTAPRILRVWLAPYVDADGDYMGEQRINMVVDVGEWVTGAVPEAPDAGVDGNP